MARKKNIPEGVKLRVLEEAGYQCAYCGHRDGLNLTAHHIKRKRDGGKDTPENLIALCYNCHNRVERVSSVIFHCLTVAMTLCSRSDPLSTNSAPISSASRLQASSFLLGPKMRILISPNRPLKLQILLPLRMIYERVSRSL